MISYFNKTQSSTETFETYDINIQLFFHILAQQETTNRWRLNVYYSWRSRDKHSHY